MSRRDTWTCNLKGVPQNFVPIGNGNGSPGFDEVNAGKSAINPEIKSYSLCVNTVPSVRIPIPSYGGCPYLPLLSYLRDVKFSGIT